MLRKLGFAVWFISIGIYRLTFKRWCYGVGGYAPGTCVILVYARIVCVHSELCAKASLVHTQLRPWSAERFDELMQVQLSTDFKSSESRNEIAPKSSLSIVLGQATQVYISILKAGHLPDLGQPANILKPHFPLYSA